MHQILENIKALRKIRGYSQESMAIEMGITQSSYARFEAEGSKIDFRLVEQACRIFDLSVDQMMNFHASRFDRPARESMTTTEPDRPYPDKTTYIKSLRERNEYLEKRLSVLEDFNRTLKEQVSDKAAIIEMLLEKRKGE
ncbi:MAG: helix-turn-helix domain-containing protein [Salibacteraceae bacterium]